MQCSVNQRDSFYDVAFQWGTRKSEAFAFVEKRTRAYVQYVHVLYIHVRTVHGLYMYMYMYSPCACARVGTVEVSMADCCTRHGSADHTITLEG